MTPDAGVTLAAAVAAYAGLLDAAVARSGLPPGDLELVRLRVAQLLGADPQLTPTLGVCDSEQRAALRSWPTSPAFTAVQRNVLALAEQFLVDARGVTDRETAPIAAHTGEAGLLTLTIVLGLIESQQRLAVALQAREEEAA